MKNLARPRSLYKADMHFAGFPDYAGFTFVHGATMVTRRKYKQGKRPKPYAPSREDRIKALLAGGFISDASEIPANAIPAALELQAPYVPCVYKPKLFYADEPFACRDCKKPQVWTAAQQLWWYERCKGSVRAIAVYCHDCRKKRREQKELHRISMEAGMARKKALKESESAPRNA